MSKGQPDPTECLSTEATVCGTLSFGRNVTDVCPVLCNNCPAISTPERDAGSPEANSTDDPDPSPTKNFAEANNEASDGDAAGPNSAAIIIAVVVVVLLLIVGAISLFRQRSNQQGGGDAGQRIVQLQGMAASWPVDAATEDEDYEEIAETSVQSTPAGNTIECSGSTQFTTSATSYHDASYYDANEAAANNNTAGANSTNNTVPLNPGHTQVDAPLYVSPDAAAYGSPVVHAYASKPSGEDESVDAASGLHAAEYDSVLTTATRGAMPARAMEGDYSSYTVVGEPVVYLAVGVAPSSNQSKTAPICIQKTSKGPCQNRVLVGTGAVRCADHTCQHLGCSEGKSSKLQYCNTHSMMQNPAADAQSHAQAAWNSSPPSVVVDGGRGGGGRGGGRGISRDVRKQSVYNGFETNDSGGGTIQRNSSARKGSVYTGFSGDTDESGV
jgi:hypothetical protein